MATHRTAKIPFSRLVKIGIWSNEKAKTTLKTVYNQLKAAYPDKEVYIMNGGFFSMVSSIPACWGCKADGKFYSNDWLSTCFMAMKDNQIEFFKQGTAFPDKYTDGISGYPALIENGAKSSNYHEAPDGKSDRGRTMIGFNKNTLFLSCIGDCSGSTDFTLKEELNYMLNLGCTSAMNLDGGGSSQCNFNGSTITSSRKVSNFVYAIVTPDQTANISAEMRVQMWLNSTYNSGLIIDGSLGKLSKAAIIKGMQKECGVAADGSWGPASKKAYKTLSVGSKNNTTNKVKLLQCALCRKGYWNMELIDTFNDTLKNQVILYQRSKKLAVDGMVGPATITSLLS